MKKILLVMPLAILLANCTTSRNTSRSGSTGTNGSASSSTSTDMNTGTSASGTGSMGTTTTASATNSGATASYTTLGMHSGDLSVYDPNNLMQNPEKYKTPTQLGAAGGWTYLNDWRVNTNFLPEAVGQWQLVPTPEVASYWMADMNKPENYAAYWTPEAVQFRYDASVAAINDSIMRATGGSGTTGAVGSAGSSNIGNTGSNNVSTGSTSGTTATTTTGAAPGSTTNSATTMTGSTGVSTQAANANSSSSNNLIATNGNRFMMPKLNLYIENGSFTGFTGWNNIIGALTVNGGQLHFSESIPSTNIQCSGGFDQSAYMDRLRRADAYDVVNNQLRLKQGNEILMVFAKSAQQ